MERSIFNVQEPSGKAVIEHATGRIAPVVKPRGDVYIKKVFTSGAIERAAAARRLKNA